MMPSRSAKARCITLDEASRLQFAELFSSLRLYQDSAGNSLSSAWGWSFGSMWKQNWRTNALSDHDRTLLAAEIREGHSEDFDIAQMSHDTQLQFAIAHNFAALLG